VPQARGREESGMTKTNGTPEIAVTNGGSDAIQIAQHINQIQALGQTLVKSGLLPQGVRTPEAAVAIILKGRELGIPPMQALSHIHVINGKPTLSAELMLAMVMKAGHEVWIVETTSERCAIAGKRRGSGREQSLTFTLEDAQRAGVTTNQTWKKYPDAMLRARAISAFCRMFAPDVLMGVSYTPEELGADVDGEGNVLTVEAPAVAQPAVVEAEEVVDATAAPSAPPLELGQQSGAPSEPASITRAQIQEFAAIAKHTGLDSATMARVAESFLDRDLPAGLKSLTSDEAAELVSWSHDRWSTEADAYRVPVGEEAA